MIRYSFTSVTKFKESNTKDISMVNKIKDTEQDLHCLMRDLQLAIIIADNIKYEQFFVLSSITEFKDEEKPTSIERAIYISVLRKFRNFISDNINVLKNSESKVFELINTVIVVDGNRVTWRCYDTVLLKEIKKQVEKEGFDVQFFTS